MQGKCCTSKGGEIRQDTFNKVQQTNCTVLSEDYRGPKAKWQFSLSLIAERNSLGLGRWCNSKPIHSPCPGFSSNLALRLRIVQSSTQYPFWQQSVLGNDGKSSILSDWLSFLGFPVIWQKESVCFNPVGFNYIIVNVSSRAGPTVRKVYGHKKRGCMLLHRYWVSKHQKKKFIQTRRISKIWNL